MVCEVCCESVRERGRGEQESKEDRKKKSKLRKTEKKLQMVRGCMGEGGLRIWRASETSNQ